MTEEYIYWLEWMDISGSLIECADLKKDAFVMCVQNLMLSL
jgi:hypothetical protein